MKHLLRIATGASLVAGLALAGGCLLGYEEHRVERDRDRHEHRDRDGHERDHDHDRSRNEERHDDRIILKVDP